MATTKSGAKQTSIAQDMVMQEDFIPPVPGATMHTAQNGPNAGKRYWAMRSVDNRGSYQSTFLKWVDKPSVSATQKIDQLEKTLKKIVELNKLKMPEEDSSEDE